MIHGWPRRRTEMPARDAHEVPATRRRRGTTLAVALAIAVLWPAHSRAADPSRPALPALDHPRGAPLPWGSKPASTHVPYTQGDCSTCHERKGPNPGKPSVEGDQLCFGCHEGLTQHAHAFRNCSRCHNAHDSRRKHLLRADLERCKVCHAGKF